ncbi:DUF262 domain-containing protein [Aurantivibrio infirmus]
MENSVNYELHTLPEILGSELRKFQVPDYQRGYSWETHQRNDLVGDIEGCLKHENKHFTGTIVASTDDENQECFNVVDGQQRLTTIVLLVSCLVRHSKISGLEALVEVSLDEVVKTYLYSGLDSGNTSFKFNPIEMQRKLFQDLVVHGVSNDSISNTKSDENLINAVKEFDLWLLGQEKSDLDNLFRVINERLGFLFYAPKNDSEVGLMFEVINNRGKPLSELEKIKNYIIYFAEKNGVQDLKSAVNDGWPIILKSLNSIGYTSNEDENSFLRYCWLVFGSWNKAKSYHVYDSLKETMQEIKNGNISVDLQGWQFLKQFVVFIKDAARNLDVLYNSKDLPGKSSNSRSLLLERIACQPNLAGILPLYIAVSTESGAADKLDELLVLLEKVNFRVYISGVSKRNDSGHGILFEWANRFYGGLQSQSGDNNTRLSISELKQNLIQFAKDNAKDIDLIKALTLDVEESGDYYSWHGLLYFLARYECSFYRLNNQSERLTEFLVKRSSDKTNDHLEREHIWATQSKDRVSKHAIEASPDIAKKVSFNKRRLGNFTLLRRSQNSKFKDKEIEEKVKLFGNNDLKLNADMENLFEEADSSLKSRWTNNVVGRQVDLYTVFLDKLEQRYIDFALREWSLEPINIARVSIDTLRTWDAKGAQIYHIES